MSIDTFNESRISTVIVNVSQVLTVDKRVLTGRVGHLPSERLADVEARLRTVLGL